LEEKTLTIPVPWWFLRKRVISTGSLVFLVFLFFLFFQKGRLRAGEEEEQEEETCVESN